LHTINVVLVGVTGMLNQLVKGALDVPDIRIAADVPADSQIELRTQHGTADVVIIGANGAGAAAEDTAHELLRRQPALKVLAIRDLGRTGSFYELHTKEVELSKEALLEAVRSAHADPP
jgi:hypothetical protein